MIDPFAIMYSVLTLMTKMFLPIVRAREQQFLELLTAIKIQYKFTTPDPAGIGFLLMDTLVFRCAPCLNGSKMEIPLRESHFDTTFLVGLYNLSQYVLRLVCTLA